MSELPSDINVRVTSSEVTIPTKWIIDSFIRIVILIFVLFTNNQVQFASDKVDQITSEIKSCANSSTLTLGVSKSDN